MEIKREVPQYLKFGAREAQVGWMLVPLTDQRKEEENEAFVLPHPQITIGSPVWGGQENIVGVSTEPSSISVYAKLEFTSGGTVQLFFYKTFTVSESGRPNIKDENPVIESIPGIDGSIKVQYIGLYQFIPARTADMIKYGTAKEYASKTRKMIIDSINTTPFDTTVSNAYRMLMLKYREGDNTFWYKRDTVALMTVPLAN